MPTVIDLFTVENNGWTVRVERPDHPHSAPALLLLHGWTGDENVMWVFTRKLTGQYWMFAPRGPVKAPEGGFGWEKHTEPGLPEMVDFQPNAVRILQAMPGWVRQAGAPDDILSRPFHVMGFSQGAAMAYTLTAQHPNRVGRMAALAGFLPTAPSQPNLLTSFKGKQIYIAHGSQDETIPVETAREAVQVLEANGAQVTYCESEIGHKLSVSCLKGLEEFFSAAKTPRDR